MKKGVFTVANYFAPKRGLLSMHCSAIADPVMGRSSRLFGLSRTGKTTLCGSDGAAGAGVERGAVERPRRRTRDAQP